MKEEIKHWIIYMYTFPNGKRYIGKTHRTLEQRQGSNFNGYKTCTVLWKAIQKYGIDNIQQEILFEADMTNESATRFEQICILLFKTNCNKFRNPMYGYNLTDGGEGLNGWKPDEERLAILRKQMAEFHKQRIGVPISEESREKMRKAKLGKKQKPRSQETKEKISRANSRENMSEETRIRRSESKKKRVVAVNNTTNGKIIFNSCEDVSKYFNVSGATVTRWCKKLRKPSVDYTFDYLSANND